MACFAGRLLDRILARSLASPGTRDTNADRRSNQAILRKSAELPHRKCHSSHGSNRESVGEQRQNARKRPIQRRRYSAGRARPKRLIHPVPSTGFGQFRARRELDPGNAVPPVEKRRKLIQAAPAPLPQLRAPRSMSTRKSSWRRRVSHRLKARTFARQRQQSGSQANIILFRAKS